MGRAGGRGGSQVRGRVRGNAGNCYLIVSPGTAAHSTVHCVQFATKWFKPSKMLMGPPGIPRTPGILLESAQPLSRSAATLPLSPDRIQQQHKSGNSAGLC